MSRTLWAAWADELTKLSAQGLWGSLGQVGALSGATSRAGASALKVPTKLTNYSRAHTVGRAVPTGTAAAAKSVVPPVVK